MKSRIRRFARRALRGLTREVVSRDETNTVLLAKLHVERIRQAGNNSTLDAVEFKAFSQGGEDGIIQYLIHRVPVEHKTFVEFGVENYTESNTRFLLINDNWRGLVLDGSKFNINYIRDDGLYWKHDLKAECVFVTRENINDILSASGFIGDIGLLSIDLDGNDYWVWDAINTVKPSIVVCEYNSIFGADRAVTVPYDQHFVCSEAHYSHLYFGASLAALCCLAEKKGYDFVGCNSVGVNAFFVRSDLRHGLPTWTAKEGYVSSNVRQSRDSSGNLSYLSGEERIECIRELPLYDIGVDRIIRVEEIMQRGQ